MRTLEPNGHRHVEPVSHVRLTKVERRLTEIAQSGETRVAVLRDAIADFIAAELASRDEEIALLKNQVAELTNKLEAKTAVDLQVADIAQRLDARQVAREERAQRPQRPPRRTWCSRRARSTWSTRTGRQAR